MKRNRIVYVSLVAAAILGRLIMQAFLPVLPMPGSSEDDLLMLNYAARLSTFHWLGAYSAAVMEKLPGYAVFLAIGKILHLPYMVWLGIFWCAACLVFLRAIRPLIRNQWCRLCSFLLLLYCPIMLDAELGQRIYNCAVIPGLTILAASGSIGAFGRLDAGLKKQLPWLILAAISYMMMTLVRFDTHWLAVFLLGAGLVTVIASWKRTRMRQRVILAVFLILPFILSAGGKLALSGVNALAYGIRENSDFNAGNFARTCANLMRIEDRNTDPEVYVSREAMEKAFSVSPTFAVFQPHMEAFYEAGPHGMLTETGEFSREYYAWYIRGTAAGLGHYQDGRETEAFWGQIARELESAFASGDLQEKQGWIISPFTGRLTGNKILPILRHSMRASLIPLVTWRYIGAAYNAVSDEGEKSLYENMTNQKIPSTASSEEETDGYDRAIAGVNHYIQVWLVAGPGLALMAVLLFIGQGISFFRKNRGETLRFSTEDGSGALLVIEAGLLLAMLANLFVLSANYYMYEPGIYSGMRFYAGGAYAFWQMFVCLCMGSGVQLFSNKGRENGLKKDG